MNIVKYILPLLILLLFGVFFGQADVFGIMRVVTFFLLILLISGIVLIIGSIKNKTKLIKSSRTVIVSIFTLGIVVLISMKVKQELTIKKATEIVSLLNEFKENNELYPNTINEVGYNGSTISYQPLDSNRKEYKIRYLIDGWHLREYSSKTEKWTTSE